MGAGQSIDVPSPASLAKSGTVNLMITQEVAERWQAKQQQFSVMEKKEEKLTDFGGAGDACSDNKPIPVLTFPSKEEEKSVFTDEKLSIREESAIETKKEPEPLKASLKLSEKLETGNTFPSSSTPPPSINAAIGVGAAAPSLILKQDFISPLSEDFLESPASIQEDLLPTPAPSSTQKDFGSPAPPSIQENESPIMNKLISHFQAQNDGMKESASITSSDMENGTVVGSPKYQKNGLSTLLPEQKQPFEPQSFQPEDFQYEEVNETKSPPKEEEKKKEKLKFTPPPRPNFFDEESMIGVGVESEFLEEKVETHVPTPTASATSAERELHVPKLPFPIVVDQDAKGKPTFETVASWKVRDNAEREIERNNQFWQEQLERITAKVEDETWMEAEDFKRRVQQINARHPDIYSTVHVPGAHCNMLSNQIARCYEKNPGQVLKCNELVRQFAKCANNVVLRQYGNQLGR